MPQSASRICLELASDGSKPKVRDHQLELPAPREHGIRTKILARKSPKSCGGFNIWLTSIHFGSR